MMQQGGVSKATKTVNLSEDIFAGALNKDIPRTLNMFPKSFATSHKEGFLQPFATMPTATLGLHCPLRPITCSLLRKTRTLLWTV